MIGGIRADQEADFAPEPRMRCMQCQGCDEQYTMMKHEDALQINSHCGELECDH